LIRIGFAFRLAVWAALLLAVAARAQQPAHTQAGPVPPAILAAKKIFVSNAASDSGLFPSPFSGERNRAYNQFYSALKAAGQYELVADPADADLVLELQLSFTPNIPTASRPTPAYPFFRLVVYDRKTHYVLWATTEWIEFAYMQSTHDRNFGSALSALVRDFETLTGKAPAAAN